MLIESLKNSVQTFIINNQFAKYQIVAGRAPIFEKAVDTMDPSKNIRCICKVQSSPHQNLSMNQLGPVIEILKKKKKKGPIKKYYFSVTAIAWME